MDLSIKEIWTALHGMILGGLFLLAFTGGFIALWDFRAEKLDTAASTRAARRRLIAWTWAMAILAWVTVIVGTYVIYPWYRAVPPHDAAGAVLAGYPKFLLLGDPRTAGWHEFAMEWKEHVAWLTPILATAVALLVTRFPAQIAASSQARRAILALYTFAFIAALIAGSMGALINKAAPIR